MRQLEDDQAKLFSVHTRTEVCIINCVIIIIMQLLGTAKIKRH